MTWLLTCTVCVLTGSGVYLLLGRRMFSVILGFSLLAHAANLVVLAGGGYGAAAPIVVGADRQGMADPVPQAFVLTAIVISMAVTLYLIAVLVASRRRLGTTRILTPLERDSNRDPAEVRAELTRVEGGRS